ncbi:chondroitinase family polysaccharide lyase [Echinicola shivajiensis]|uniref:chondroitinase family polysaccharide lyase n=1 Tax=Echinicola shivajiensis TaxID=1035916 RepID=UPI001BFC755D|nr:chondroitinase family polysaccharide lyase [Echinicola shivajiensis]
MKHFTFLVLFFCFSQHLLLAQITGLGLNYWEPIGNSEIVTINSDGDNGDGVGDGAQKSQNLASTVGNGLSYAFGGSMQEGQSLNFKSYVFNPNISYVRLKVELYNITDEVLLVSEGAVSLTSGVVYQFELDYVPQASDDGDALEVRYIRTDDGNSARTFAIDNASLNGAYLYPEADPEPSCFDQAGEEKGWGIIGSINLSQVNNDPDNGDGAGDGALSVKSAANESYQGVYYPFECLMTGGQQLEVKAYVYNSANSYVKVKLELFNKTDSVFLNSVTKTLVPTQNPNDILSLNYFTQSTDDGDELELRLVRNDDGNTVRFFNIDYVTINQGTLNIDIIPPPLAPECALGVNIAPDIPLEAVTVDQVQEVEQIYGKLVEYVIGTTLPSDFQEQYDAAVQSYQLLNLVDEDGEIAGEVASFDEAAEMVMQFSKYLHFVDAEDSTTKMMATRLITKVAQDFCRGLISRDYNSYGFRNFSQPVMTLRDFLSDEVKDQFGYVLYTHSENFKHFWGQYEIGANYNTDWISNLSPSLFMYAEWRFPSDGQEKVRYMKGASRYLERFLTVTDGVGDGIKADGTGFHHKSAYDGYLYAFGRAAFLISTMDDTSFQIDLEHYKVLRNSIYLQRMVSNDGNVRALSLVGRNPQSRYMSTNQNDIKRLAISGGKILGLNTADPLLAGFYNRNWGSETEFNYDSVTPYENGFIQFNHYHAGAYRHNNWTAVMKGFSDNMWGAELYVTTNRYGRYQSYGALEIMYTGGTDLNDNGYDVNTWDWNYNPGTTTIVLPWEKLHGERGRIDEKQAYRFAGALTFDNKGKDLGVLEKNYGTYGLFAMDFQEVANQGFGLTYGPNTHNDSFKWKKSNFTYKDIIVCLATGISNNDNDNPTVTTLYQRMADSESGANINGLSLTSNGENTFSSSQDNWLVNSYNTGIYVYSGSGELKLWKGSQQTPNYNEIDPTAYLDNPVGDYIIGYLDHGTAPQDLGYEYVIKPNATAEDMQEIAMEKPYTVMEKSSDRHVVNFHDAGLWGMALFESSENIEIPGSLVKANDLPCLVMYQSKGKKTVKISVNNPDLGFGLNGSEVNVERDIQLKLAGQWLLSESIPNINLVEMTDSTTSFQFHIVDAMPVEVDLVKASKQDAKVRKNRIIYLETGDELSIVKNLMDQSMEGNLDWSSQDPEIVTVDQNGNLKAINKGKSKVYFVNDLSGKADFIQVFVEDRSGELKFYPNPVVSELHILKKGIRDYYIYNSRGDIQLFLNDISLDQLKVDVSKLQRGIYFLKVVDQWGNSETERFFKE